MTIFDDEKAGSYDAWYETPLGKFVDAVETHLALSMFTPKPGMKVLDVGCGTGNFSLKLARQGVLVTGIDISEEMLAIARSKAAQNPELKMEFKWMDFNQLDFEDECFDGVISMTALEFAQDLDHVYAEMYRVLKPGGQLLIGVITSEGDWGRYYLEKAKADPKSVFNYFHLKSREELENLDREHLAASKECLFVPHDAAESQMSCFGEKRMALTEKGSFVCVLFVKPGRES